MTEDPIVAEVRRARDEHARRFGYDLRRIHEDLKASESARQTWPLITNPPPERATDP